jgi:transitional endoplasmic reticulum ATPase
MRLPDENARAEIVQQHLKSLPGPLCDANVPQVVSATETFTGADLRRLVEDAKALYAFDLVTNGSTQEVTQYFVKAADGIRASKEKYAEAEARANANRPSRPVWFKPYSSYSDLSDDDS